MLIRILVIVAVASLCAPRAEAQIHAWRDANGTLVLSDRTGGAGGLPGTALQTTPVRSRLPAESGGVRERYEPLIQAHAARYAIAPDLVRAVIQVESGFNPAARSPKGAMGLMQLMPITALEMGVRNPYDPEESIRGGAGYLRQLLDRYSGSEELALASYNAGPEAVDRYGQQVPPYQETRDYVRKVGSVASRPPGTGHARGAAQGSPLPTIYKVTDVIDGRPVTRYTNARPNTGDYEVLAP